MMGSSSFGLTSAGSCTGAATPQGRPDAVERDEAASEGVDDAVGGARQGKDSAGAEEDMDIPVLASHGGAPIDRKRQTARVVSPVSSRRFSRLRAVRPKELTSWRHRRLDK
jgi:hypothetical protein